MTPFWSARKTPLWGDGFDTDGWRDITGLKTWETCSPDEMIRVFPAIARPGSTPAPAVVERIRECVAVLAWRSRPADAPLSVSAETIIKIGPAGSARWFPSKQNAWSGFTRALGVGRAARAIGIGRAATDRAREAEALGLVDAIASEIAAGGLRGYDSDVATRFVYWTGIHPVYLWPEALLSHDLYTAVGWIGHAERYARALMTRDIAEYFSATIARDPDGTTRVLDPRLAPYVRSDGIARLILTAARACLGGRRPVARLPASSGASARLSLARQIA